MPRFSTARDAALWDDGGPIAPVRSGAAEAPALAPAPPPLRDADKAILAALNQIQMLSETLVETSLDPMQQELVQFLVDAGMTLRRQILGADSAALCEPEELELDDLGDALEPRIATQDYLEFEFGDDIYAERRDRLTLVYENSDLLNRALAPALDEDLIVEEVAPDAPQSASSPGAAAWRPLEGLRLLVADDNVAHQSAARGLLEDLGATCNITGVNAAPELARMSVWDAILMDVQTPARVGLSMMRAIRADEAASGKYRTPILAFLTHASPDQIRECLNAGADGYLPKPFNKDAAIEQLEVLAIESGLEQRSRRA